MGLRNVNGFDGTPSNPDHEELNLTKYDEIHVMPTAMVNRDRQDDSSFSGSRLARSGRSQVFGGNENSDERHEQDRNYVFGNSNAQNSVSSSPAQTSMTNGYTTNVQSDGYASSMRQTSVSVSEPVQNSSTDRPLVTNERPMVFVLRNDRSCFIYEYSDRLEYYKRTENGMQYYATKLKSVAR